MVYASRNKPHRASARHKDVHTEEGVGGASRHTKDPNWLTDPLPPIFPPILTPHPPARGSQTRPTQQSAKKRTQMPAGKRALALQGQSPLPSPPLPSALARHNTRIKDVLNHTGGSG